MRTMNLGSRLAMRGIGWSSHGKYVMAIADQAVLSLFNFAIAIWLLRLLDPMAFGIYTIVMAASHAAVAVQDALTSTPLSIRYSTYAGAERKRWLLMVLGNVTYLYVATVFAVVTVATGLLAEDWLLGIGAGLFVSAFVLRSYMRSVAYAKRMEAAAIALDAPFLVLSLGALAAFQWTGATSLGWILIALGAANLIPVAASALGPLGAPVPVAPGTLPRYRPFVPEVRWSLLGVGSVLAQRQSHTAVVPALMSPAAYATLAAADTLLGPIRLAVVAVGMVLRPEMAQLVSRGDWDGIDALMRRMQILLTAFLTLLLLVATAAWPLIERVVFAGKYPDILIPFALAFAITVVQTWRAVPNFALQALHAFKSLGQLTLICAAVSFAATLAVTLAFGWLWAPIGVLAGEGLNSILILVAARRTLAARRRGEIQ